MMIITQHKTKGGTAFSYVAFYYFLFANFNYFLYPPLICINGWGCTGIFLSPTIVYYKGLPPISLDQVLNIYSYYSKGISPLSHLLNASYTCLFFTADGFHVVNPGPHLTTALLLLLGHFISAAYESGLNPIRFT